MSQTQTAPPPKNSHELEKHEVLVPMYQDNVQHIILSIPAIYGRTLQERRIMSCYTTCKNIGSFKQKGKEGGKNSSNFEKLALEQLTRNPWQNIMRTNFGA